VNGGFQPVWLRFAVLLAAAIGVIVAVWLFGILASGGG
jgi:hypothetical protein